MKQCLILLGVLLAAGGPAAAVEREVSPAAIRPGEPVVAAAMPAAAVPELASGLPLGSLSPAAPDAVSLPAAPAAEPAALAALPAAAVPELASGLPLGSLSPAAPDAASLSAAAAAAQPSRPAPGSGWSLGAKLFDGLRRAGRSTAFGAVILPVHVSGHVALLPAAMSASYVVAGVSSVVLPLPETYATFRRGHAIGFPFARAAIGSAGTLALGLVNGVMLDKPLWGVMQTFIGLGMLAPFFVGLWLRWRRAKAAPEPPAAPPGSLVTLWKHRVRHDGALRATLGAAAAVLVCALVAYGAAAAWVPAWLAAHFSAAAVANILLAIQVGKAVLFIGIFAPDVVNLLRGRPVRGFSLPFMAIYLLYVSCYTVWGFSSAILSVAGPLRDQYLVLGLRNLCEATASGLSLLALLRARRGAANSPRP